jgi:vacuolar protein-sorting-associated protein 4
VQNNVEKFMPCAASNPYAIPMRWTKLPAEKVLEPPLNAEDFFGVIAKSKPSVGPEEMHKYAKWTEEYGSEGA